MYKRVQDGLNMETLKLSIDSSITSNFKVYTNKVSILTKINKTIYYSTTYCQRNNKTHEK